MSVYNCQNYLPYAIKSILKQTFEDFEFIIVNDGSSDNTDKILKNFALRDKRIKILEQENKGLTYSLNRGIFMAKGKYIARMDADDISLKVRFINQIKYLYENCDVAVLGCNAVVIDDLGLRIAKWDNFLVHHDIDNYHMKGYGGGIIHSSAMIRKDILLKVGGYDEKWKYAQDYDLWLRLAEISRLANLPGYYIKYRKYIGSITVSQTKGQIDTAKSIHCAACKRRNVKIDYSFNSDGTYTTNLDPILIRKKWILDAYHFRYLDGYLGQKLLLVIDKIRSKYRYNFIEVIIKYIKCLYSCLVLYM